MAARQERARLRGALKDRSLTGADVVAGAEANPLWGGLRVNWLLECLPGIGAVRAERIMSDLGIAASRHLQGLGVRQHGALLEYLRREHR
jgi:hypothetical protein